MIRGLLLRHAVTDWNKERRWQGSDADRPLCEEGVAASEELSRGIFEAFGDMRPAVTSSPLLRCIQTAYAIFGNGPVELDHRLTEMRGGDVLGLREEEIRQKFPSFASDWFDSRKFSSPPGGEDMGAVLARVGCALRDLISSNTAWCAVTHLGILRAAAELLGVDEAIDPDNLSGLALLKDGSWIRWDAPESTDAKKKGRAREMRLGIGHDDKGAAVAGEAQAWAVAKGIHLPLAKDSGMSSNSVDYPDVAIKLASAVREGKVDRGILVCGSGIGMSITANKVPGIRAATVNDMAAAEAAARSNDIHIACMGAEMISGDSVREILDVWWATEFRGGRSLRKILRLSGLEQLERGRDSG